MPCSVPLPDTLLNGELDSMLVREMGGYLLTISCPSYSHPTFPPCFGSWRICRRALGYEAIYGYAPRDVLRRSPVSGVCVYGSWGGEISSRRIRRAVRGRKVGGGAKRYKEQRCRGEECVYNRRERSLFDGEFLQPFSILNRPSSLSPLFSSPFYHYYSSFFLAWCYFDLLFFF